MKNTPIIVVLVLMLVLIGMLFYRLHSLEKQLHHKQYKTEHEHHEHDDDDVGDNHEHEYPLGEKMSKFFYFKNKLGSAIKHENQELSLFYLEEIEEIAEEIIEDDVYHEGVHISVLMLDKLMPAIENMEQELEKPESTKRVDAFENLVSSCNSCHKLSEHPFIQVEVPTEEIDGQDFDPIKE